MRLHTLFASLAVASLMLGACDKPSGGSSSTNAATNTAVATTQAVATNAATPGATTGGTTAEQKPSFAEVKAHMAEHWGLAVVVRDAVIAATLDELPDVAGELADHRAPDKLTSFTEPIATMRDAAERAQKAGNYADASQAVADLARACGDCHTASGAMPTLPDETLPPNEHATKAHMLRHDYAARELWAGLVIPSDERWSKGVQALEQKPLKKGDFFEDWEVTDAMLGLDHNVHEMRTRIAAAATRDERVKVYAELVNNCASCHAATAQGPVD